MPAEPGEAAPDQPIGPAVLDIPVLRQALPAGVTASVGRGHPKELRVEGAQVPGGGRRVANERAGVPFAWIVAAVSVPVAAADS
jgi:hypothetical protein